MPRSVRASLATTSTSTSRNDSASPARCNGRSRTPLSSASTGCLRDSTRERSEIFLEAPVFSATAASAMNARESASKQSSMTPTPSSTAYSTTSTSAPRPATTSCAPTSRTSRWTAATNSPTRCGCTRWSAIRRPTTTIPSRRHCCSIAPTSMATASITAATVACRSSPTATWTSPIRRPGRCRRFACARRAPRTNSGPPPSSSRGMSRIPSR